MCDFSMKVLNNDGVTLSFSHLSGDGISAVHNAEYEEGDRIIFEVGSNVGLYWIRLDESMPETLVYIGNNPTGNVLFYKVPIGSQKTSMSPKSFAGNCHLITARKAHKNDGKVYRNLALNPYDGHEIKGFFPHSSANVETRNEAVFASRNAIDGIFENSSHGKYPYSSWGINQDPNAAMTIDFGRNVEVDQVRITLRADFPHDNWWTKGELQFSDGSKLELNFEKTALPQTFKFDKKVINNIVFTNLIKSEEDSPFPALTQIEVYGIDA